MREKTRDELFDKLAEALGGDYRHRGSLFGDRTEVELRHHDWHLFVDTIQRCEPPVTLTRLRAPYANKDGFRFALHRRTWLDRIADALGKHRMHDHSIDDRFAGTTTDEVELERFTSTPLVQELLRNMPVIHFEVKPDEGLFGAHFPDGVDELCIWTEELRDLRTLAHCVELFGGALDGLCDLGSADEHDPGVDLSTIHESDIDSSS